MSLIFFLLRYSLNYIMCLVGDLLFSPKFYESIKLGMYTCLRNRLVLLFNEVRLSLCFSFLSIVVNTDTVLLSFNNSLSADSNSPLIVLLVVTPALLGMLVFFTSQHVYRQTRWGTKRLSYFFYRFAIFPLATWFAKAGICNPIVSTSQMKLQQLQSRPADFFGWRLVFFIDFYATRLSQFSFSFSGLFLLPFRFFYYFFCLTSENYAVFSFFAKRSFFFWPTVFKMVHTGDKINKRANLSFDSWLLAVLPPLLSHQDEQQVRHSFSSDYYEYVQYAMRTTSAPFLLSNPNLLPLFTTPCYRLRPFAFCVALRILFYADLFQRALLDRIFYLGCNFFPSSTKFLSVQLIIASWVYSAFTFFDLLVTRASFYVWRLSFFYYVVLDHLSVFLKREWFPFRVVVSPLVIDYINWHVIAPVVFSKAWLDTVFFFRKGLVKFYTFISQRTHLFLPDYFFRDRFDKTALFLQYFVGRLIRPWFIKAQLTHSLPVCHAHFDSFWHAGKVAHEQFQNDMYSYRFQWMGYLYSSLSATRTGFAPSSLAANPILSSIKSPSPSSSTSIQSYVVEEAVFLPLKPISSFYRWYQFTVTVLFIQSLLFFMLLLRTALHWTPSTSVLFSSSSFLNRFVQPLELFFDLSTGGGWQSWFSISSMCSVVLSWRLTEIASMMLFAVSVVSTCVFIYAKDYMSGDPGRRRFLLHLLFFTTFMNIFVISDDFITLFIGWEGVGLSSFFLINFWYTRIAATKAAIKAMLTNRVGDCALLFAIALAQFYFGSTHFPVLFDSVLLDLTYREEIVFGLDLVTFLVVLLFIAAMAKSAQFGLHSWLPDAMEGPTPVSALIHAATMVTAGVLLLIKCDIFVSLSSCGPFIAFIGVLTAIFAGSVAVVQHDLKRIIAYSTCSQLGLMVMACGIGYPIFAFFHLITHAFFKALLFLSAGVVVHALGDEQDIRRMGGLQQILPFTHSCFLIGTLSIIGFPFFSGFYSKEFLVLTTSLYGNALFFLCCVATSLTALYSIRLYCRVMLGSYNGYLSRVWGLHSNRLPFFVRSNCEPWNGMLTAMLILSIFSIFSGFLLSPFFTVFSFQFQGFSHQALFSLQSEFLSLVTRWLPFLLTVLVMSVYLLSFFNRRVGLFIVSLKLKFPLFYAGLVQRWFFDNILSYFIYRFFRLVYFIYAFSDKGFAEILLGLRLFTGLFQSRLSILWSRSIFGISLGEAFLISLLTIFIFGFGLLFL